MRRPNQGGTLEARTQLEAQALASEEPGCCGHPPRMRAHWGEECVWWGEGRVLLNAQPRAIRACMCACGWMRRTCLVAARAAVLHRPQPVHHQAPHARPATQRRARVARASTLRRAMHRIGGAAQLTMVSALLCRLLLAAGWPEPWRGSGVTAWRCLLRGPSTGCSAALGRLASSTRIGGGMRAVRLGRITRLQRWTMAIVRGKGAGRLGHGLQQVLKEAAARDLPPAAHRPGVGWGGVFVCGGGGKRRRRRKKFEAGAPCSRWVHFAWLPQRGHAHDDTDDDHACMNEVGLQCMHAPQQTHERSTSRVGSSAHASHPCVRTLPMPAGMQFRGRWKHSAAACLHSATAAASCATCSSGVRAACIPRLWRLPLAPCCAMLSWGGWLLMMVWPF